jgi:acyl CoA:acetate/3-ketoacid CoA transferase
MLPHNPSILKDKKNDPGRDVIEQGEVGGCRINGMEFGASHQKCD